MSELLLSVASMGVLVFVVTSMLGVGGAFVIGDVMGGANRDVRKVIGFATAQRNYGAAMLFPIAWYLNRREIEPATTGRDEPRRGPAASEV